MFDGVSALQLTPAGYALAYVSYADARPCLRVCEHGVPDDPDGLGETIEAAVRTHELEGAPCVAVLAPPMYSVRQIDPPAVPEDELREAARWAMKDLVDFNVADAIVDVFTVPGGARGDKTFAVAAERSVVERHVEIVKRAGLDLVAVDITDMALRNVASRLAEADRGVCLTYLASGLGVLVFARHGLLQMVRTIEADLLPLRYLCWQDPAETGEEDEEVQKPEPTGEAQEVLDELLLEAQRSLDFYEHGMGQDPISRLTLCPLEISGTVVREYLDQNLPASIDVLDVAEVLDIGEGVPQAVQARCLPAIGGALRGAEVTP